MRYLKYLNESLVIDDIRELIITSFVELIDIGFYITVEDQKIEYHIEIDTGNQKSRFKYINIKNELIQFITIINEKYSIKCDIFFGYGHQYLEESIENILQETVSDDILNIDIEWIEIKIDK